MGMGFAPTWLRQVSPPASQNHFNNCSDPAFFRGGGRGRRLVMMGATPVDVQPAKSFLLEEASFTADQRTRLHWELHLGTRDILITKTKTKTKMIYVLYPITQ